MKMTMNIDEALLARVVEATGAASKTEAVNMALKEIDRKARLAEFGKKGLGLSKAEILEAVEPEYSILSLRVAESSPL